VEVLPGFGGAGRLFTFAARIGVQWGPIQFPSQASPNPTVTSSRDKELLRMKSPSECTSIEEVREAIDALDREIVAALGQRFQYVKAITRFKKTVEDVQAPDRRRQVLAQRRAWAAEAGLDPDLVEQLYRLLIDHFVAEELKDLRLA
jgi:isochorismate pyruvate lyase